MVYYYISKVYLQEAYQAHEMQSLRYTIYFISRPQLTWRQFVVFTLIEIDSLTTTQHKSFIPIIPCGNISRATFTGIEAPIGDGGSGEVSRKYSNLCMNYKDLVNTRGPSHML